MTTTMFTRAPAQPLTAGDRLTALKTIEDELTRRYGWREISADELAVTMENARLAKTDALAVMAARLRLRNAGVRVAPAGKRLTRRERQRGDQYGSGVRATAA